MKTFTQWLQQEYSFPQASQMGDVSFQIKNLARTLQLKKSDQISNDDINKLKQTYTQIIQSSSPDDKNKHKNALINMKKQLMSLKPSGPAIDPRVDKETHQNFEYSNKNKSYT